MLPRHMLRKLKEAGGCAAAALRFVVVCVGGVTVGLVVGWLASRARSGVNDAPVQIILSLLTPFAAYIPAETLGLSGVLAVVTTGLYIGAINLRLSPGTRLQSLAVWEVVVFLLNGFVFILIGLQLPAIMHGLSDEPLLRLLGYAALISLTAIVVRFLWVFPAAYLPRLLSRRLRARDPYPGWRNVTVVAWTGMRGVVSLAAAFALPFTLSGSDPFPHRELILFLTFGVIVATLVLQGLSLPWLLRTLGVVDAAAQAREERQARLEAAKAAMARLDKLAENGHHAEHLDRLRWRYDRRNRRLALDLQAPESALCEMTSGAYESLRRDLLNAEREVIHRLRDEGTISDEVMLRIDRELDLEDTRIET